MKKGRNLLLLVLVLVVLGGVLLYLNSHPAKKSSDSTTANTQTIDIAKLDSKKISKITLKTKSSVLNITKNGTKWASDSAPGINLSEASVESLLTNFASMQAEKVIANNLNDIAQYGLQAPSAIATVTMEDGSVKEFSLGSKSPDGSYYYLILKGNNKIYTVASTVGDIFSYTVNNLIDASIPTLDSQNVTYLKFTHKGQKPVEFKINDNKSQTYTNSVMSWLMTSPYSMMYGVNDQNLGTTINAAISIKINTVVDPNATNLSKYGLDKPSLDLVVKDTKNTLHLIFGNDEDADNTYFKLASSNAVYTCSKSSLDAFNVKPFELSGKYADMINIDDVDSIDFQGPQGNHTLTFSRVTKKATKSGESDTVVTTFKVDNKVIDDQKFRNWYQELIALTVDAENDKSVQEKPEYKTVFHINKANKQPITLEYCPYNSDFYTVFTNGKSDFVISKDKINKIGTDLESLIK